MRLQKNVAPNIVAIYAETEGQSQGQSLQLSDFPRKRPPRRTLVPFLECTAERASYRWLRGVSILTIRRDLNVGVEAADYIVRQGVLARLNRASGRAA